MSAVDKRTAPVRVLIVNPAHRDQNIWAYDRMCEALGYKFFTPPLGLLTVAALLPATWHIRVIDKNVTTCGIGDLRDVDVVFTGGMLTQRADTLDIIREVQEQGKRVVVGGFDASGSPDIFASADVIVIGEAEASIDDLVRAVLEAGRRQVIGSERRQANLSSTPPPRYDLVNLNDYLAPAIQFSRGCPYLCEFCDIIEIYGRVPRTKTWQQIEGELEALYQSGHRGLVFAVDDNLVGNRKYIRETLQHVTAWQQRRGFPFEFYSSSSINLAKDGELLHLMRGANVTALFIGIESTDLETLRMARKKQSMQVDQLEAIDRIHSAGIFVTAGFVLGFDGEARAVAPGILDFIEAARVPVAGASLLVALPKTQMWRRMEKEGRLRTADGWRDQLLKPLNFEPTRARDAILRDYAEVLDGSYAVEAFYHRLRRQLAAVPRPTVRTRLGFGRRLQNLRRLIWLLAFLQLDPAVWKEFWRTIWFCLKSCPWHLRTCVAVGAAYLDYGLAAKRIAAQARAEAEQIRPRVAA